MLLQIHIEVRIVPNKCVETRWRAPKRIMHGEGIVQTTTQ